MSDISLALTSDLGGVDNDDDDEQSTPQFVGKRMVTPVVGLPIPSRTMKFKATTRLRHVSSAVDKGRAAGDRAKRNAARDVTGTSGFHLNSPSTSTPTTAPPMGSPGLRNIPPQLFTTPPPSPTADQRHRHQSKLRKPPPFETSASVFRINHARTIQAVQCLRENLNTHLNHNKIKADLQALQQFEREHPRQLELWCEAFEQWPEFINNLFPASLLHGPPVPLLGVDGEVLLTILPSTTTICFIQFCDRTAKHELRLSSLQRRLLGVPHIAEMALSLHMSLSVLDAALDAARMYKVMSSFLSGLKHMESLARVFEIASEECQEIFEDGERFHGSPKYGMNRRVSVWTFLLLASHKGDTFVQRLNEEGLYQDLASIALDKVVDMVDQVDFEMGLQTVLSYILTCHASLSQSLAVIRITCKEMGDNLHGGGGGKAAEQAAPLHLMDAFREDVVQGLIRRTYEQVRDMMSRIHHEMHEVYCSHLGIWEASSIYPGVPLPIGLFVKCLAIFIEMTRTRDKPTIF